MSNKKEVPKSTKEESKTMYVPTRTVVNKQHRVQLISYGQISPNTELMISFEVQGKLMKGDKTLKAGSKFSQGQILYSIDNSEAFYSLSARKSSLSNLIINILPDIELDFPSEKKKWQKFLNDLSPDRLLPKLPVMSSGKEQMFLVSRSVIPEYYNLKSQEIRLQKYMYLAPFHGTVIEVYSEPGSIINPGVQIAKIAQTGNYEVKVPISMEDLELYKEKSTAEFTDPKGKVIAAGKILRVSDVVNQQTQSADVYYSIKPVKGEKVYNGMYVNVSIDRQVTKETFVLPRTAFKEGLVRILLDSNIVTAPVTIVGTKPDSIFVTGLKDGQLVLLEQIQTSDTTVVYKGVDR